MIQIQIYNSNKKNLVAQIGLVKDTKIQSEKFKPEHLD